jgi:AraC-like DNA-binding protein
MSEIQELTEFLKILTAETDRKFKEIAEEHRIRGAETDRKFRELTEENRIASEERRAASAELDRKFAETGRELKELTRNISGIADSNGLSAEQYFSAASKIHHLSTA